MQVCARQASREKRAEEAETLRAIAVVILRFAADSAQCLCLLRVLTLSECSH